MNSEKENGKRKKGTSKTTRLGDCRITANWIDGTHYRSNRPNVKPIKHYGYRVAPTVAKELQENIETMQKLGVIEESQSPWASPVLLVPKKDGTRRFCTDFRGLNSVTKSDVFPLPRIDDIMDKLGRCQYFTSIDLKHAFWQIPMRHSDKEKTSFISGNRLWQYRRMAFGLKNSPATVQRCISLAIGDLR
jgi:hypothetical protein